jgi:polar amino acid transport system substrate-binding protein
MMFDHDEPASPLEIWSSIAVMVLLFFGIFVLLKHTSHRTSEARMQELRRRGVAEEGLSNEPPWVIVQGDGSLAGIGPDIDRAALAAVGVKQLAGQSMEYGAMIPALQAGRIDLVSSGSQDITPQRCKKVLFSEPVVCDVEAFLAKKSVADSVKSYRDIAMRGLRVGVCGGCVEQRYAATAGVSAEKSVVFPEGVSAVKMLEDARIDLIALPAASLETLKATTDVGDGYVLSTFNDAPMGCSAASFRKEDYAMRDAYNRGLQILISSHRYAEIMAKYGMASRVVLREGKTTEQLCAGE